MRWITAGAALLLATAGDVHATNFATGNLVVVRIGDGTAPLTNAAFGVFLDEYTPAGALVQTVALPTTTTGSNMLITSAGTATTEGSLNLSTDGQSFVYGGYAAPVGTNSVASGASIMFPRVVARIALNGTVDTTTALTDAYSGVSIRGVASDNGSQFWLSGGAGGVRYATLGATTSTQLNTTPPTNTRVVNIVNNQLYVSSASGAFQGPATVGTGLPTTSGQAIVLLPGFPTATGPSPDDYFFADANTVYVADDRSAASSGGLQKWTLVAGTWTFQYLFNNGVSGCRGVTGVVNGGVATLYATTSLNGANSIITVTDAGASSAVTPIATAGTNTVFRGVRLLAAPGSGTGTQFCFGDGSGTACPCGNNSTPGANEGCLSSLGVGARLAASGNPSLAADTVVLAGSQMPNSSALYFQGTTQLAGGAGSVFGDGLRCAGGSVVRLGTKTNVGGSSQYPSGTDAAVSVKGLVGSPGVRTYQAWYRNAASFCTTSTFNLSNGLEIAWTP